jgi:hypothetical protein
MDTLESNRRRARERPVVRRRVARVALAATAIAGAYAACSPPDPELRCLTAVLPNCVAGPDLYSDEACASFDAFEMRTPARVDGSRAPGVDAPTQDAVLPADPAPTFRWHGQLASRDLGDDVRDALPGDGSPARARTLTWRDELARWTTLVPAAHAHCAPFTGLGYSLIFRAGGRTVLYVEQSATEYTPSADAWGRLRNASGPIELTVRVARFRSNAVDEGPYAPTEPRRFTVAR